MSEPTTLSTRHIYYMDDATSVQLSIDLEPNLDESDDRIIYEDIILRSEISLTKFGKEMQLCQLSLEASHDLGDPRSNLKLFYLKAGLEFNNTDGFSKFLKYSNEPFYPQLGIKTDKFIIVSLRGSLKISPSSIGECAWKIESELSV